MVSNVGNRAAGLAQITIESRNRKTSATWYLTSDLDKKIIEPGKSYMIKASNGGEVPAVLPLEEASAIKTVINDVSPNYNLVLSYFFHSKYFMCLSSLCKNHRRKSEIKKIL